MISTNRSRTRGGNQLEQLEIDPKPKTYEYLHKMPNDTETTLLDITAMLARSKPFLGSSSCHAPYQAIPGVASGFPVDLANRCAGLSPSASGRASPTHALCFWRAAFAACEFVREWLSNRPRSRLNS